MNRKKLRETLIRKRKLRKSLVLLGLNLCASLYIAIGTYGSLVAMTPAVVPLQSAWSAAIYGAAALLLIRGIYFFGTAWDRILAKEAAAKAAAGTGSP